MNVLSISIALLTLSLDKTKTNQADTSLQSKHVTNSTGGGYQEATVQMFSSISFKKPAHHDERKTKQNEQRTNLIFSTIIKGGNDDIADANKIEEN